MYYLKILEKVKKYFSLKIKGLSKSSTLKFDWIKTSRNWTNPKKEKKASEGRYGKKARKMRKSDKELMRTKQERLLSTKLKKHP